MIDLLFEIASLPEGWEGTPDEFLQFIKENSTFSFDGVFPTGQIGGPRPTEDVGIWYGDNSIEKFRDGAYRTISDVPVGAMLPYPSALTVPPENYLLMQGQSINRADYPELFAVLGITYGSESGTTFTLPDAKGRVPVGAGVGDYHGAYTGKLEEVIVGSYFGTNWLNRREHYANAPKQNMRNINETNLVQGNRQWVDTTQPAFGVQWIIRYR